MSSNDWGTVQIKRFSDASKTIKIMNWKGAQKIPYIKYNIKESDMRIKTATFSSPQYLDLTTGLFAIRIVSKYHENFAGLVLDVTYDEKKGTYDYQCQDFSRFYISKNELIVAKKPIWKVLMALITHGKLKINKKMSRKGYTKILSGLRAIKKYNQSLYPKQHYKGNPFLKNISFIARDKTTIEVIRDIVYSSPGYFDVYFNDRGILQIEPLSKIDWENTGLHISNDEFSDRKFKFSTTNAITGVRINGTDAKGGKTIWDSDVLNKLYLTAFFGTNITSISNPIQSKATKSSGSSSSSSTVTNKNNPYGTKSKTVYLNIDSIDGDSSDNKKMTDMAAILRKNGWSVTICGVGNWTHYARRAEVKNGIWFTLYGGACAGTLYETCTNDWFRRPIVNHGSRTVVGFFPPAGDIRKGGKYYSWLPRAHDDGFSSYNFTGVSHMADMLTRCAVPFMYAKNPSEMVSKFLKGGDNPEACNKNWKFISR